MTVSTTDNRVSFAGNGVTTVFSFPNRFLLDADIVVIQTVDATGVATTKVLTTDYTLTGAGGAAGGNVTMLVAPPAGTTLTVYRDPALTQPTDLVNGDSLNVDTAIELGFDRSTLQIQRVRELLGRSLRLPDSDADVAATAMNLPVKADRLGKFLMFDVTTGLPAAAATTDTPVSGFMVTVLDDTTAAAVLATLGVTDSTNTKIGEAALSNNTGIQNTANGQGALQSNTSGNYNTANGQGTLQSNTTGYNNTANGVSALQSNTTGGNNTANGAYALLFNTTGVQNTANGQSALYSNTTGSYNTANGVNALYSNTTGYGNTANGVSALQSNTTGSSNTANGQNALQANTTGYSNAANGVSALYSNTTGIQNTANGQNALQSNTTGDYNTANGQGALFSNTIGTQNTANGQNALQANTTGNYNTANGQGALQANTTGGNNACFGYQAGADAVANLTTQSNYVVVGNTSTANANIKVAWTVTSDARDKMAFAAVPHGLSFVLGLKPIAYRFKKSRALDEPTGPVRYGFKAQDVLQLEEAAPVVINADDPENLKYNETSLIPILVRAIQELSSKNAKLEARLVALENA